MGPGISLTFSLFTLVSSLSSPVPFSYSVADRFVGFRNLQPAGMGRLASLYLQVQVTNLVVFYDPMNYCETVLICGDRTGTQVFWGNYA